MIVCWAPDVRKTGTPGPAGLPRGRGSAIGPRLPLNGVIDGVQKSGKLAAPSGCPTVSTLPPLPGRCPTSNLRPLCPGGGRQQNQECRPDASLNQMRVRGCITPRWSIPIDLLSFGR